MGEIFSAIVSLHNQTDQILQDVILTVNSTKKNKYKVCLFFKTDIQTATQRITLNSNDPNDSTKVDLSPDQSVCRVLQHEVKELGNHSYE